MSSVKRKFGEILISHGCGTSNSPRGQAARRRLYESILIIMHFMFLSNAKAMLTQ
jgi:hypothetical protein